MAALQATASPHFA